MASPRLHPDLRSTNLLRSLQISPCLNFPAQFHLNSAILHSNGRIATFNDETLSFRMSREEIQRNEIGHVYRVRVCWCDFWLCIIQMRDVTSLNSRVKYILRETSSVKLEQTSLLTIEETLPISIVQRISTFFFPPTEQCAPMFIDPMLLIVNLPMNVVLRFNRISNKGDLMYRNPLILIYDCEKTPSISKL